MTALKNLLVRHKEEGGLTDEFTPLEKAVLYRYLREGDESSAEEAAAELALIDERREVNASISEERRIKIEQLKRELAKWRTLIPNDGKTYQITSIGYEVVKEKKA